MIRVPVQLRLELARGTRRILWPTLLIALLVALASQGQTILPGNLEIPPARSREDIWTLSLLLLLPLCALHYAQGTRAQEHSWVSSFPQGALRERAISGWATLLIGCLTLVGIGVLAEASVPREIAQRHTRAVDLGPPRRIPAGEELALLIEPGVRSANAYITLEVVAGGGAGPTTDVQLQLSEQSQDSSPTSAVQRIDGRDRVEVRVPGKSGPLHVVLRCLGPGDAVMPGGRCLTLLEEVPFAEQASLEIGARAVVILALLLLIVAPLRRWLAPGLSTVLALGLILLGASSPALPMDQLAQALTMAGEGRLPRTPRGHEFLPLILMLVWQGFEAIRTRTAAHREACP